MSRFALIAALLLASCAPGPDVPKPQPTSPLADTVYQTVRSDMATRAKICREIAADESLDTEETQNRYFADRVTQVQKASVERIAKAFRSVQSPGGTFDPAASRKAWGLAAEGYERVSR